MDNARRGSEDGKVKGILKRGDEKEKASEDRFERLQ